MFLLVVKRLVNKQFKAIKSVTHPNQKLTQNFSLKNVFQNFPIKFFSLKILTS